MKKRILKKIERLKFIIADRLNENPDYCWADLVMWALSYKPFFAILYKDEFHQGCRPENEGTSYPYCGKCLKYYPELEKELNSEKNEQEEVIL